MEIVYLITSIAISIVMFASKWLVGLALIDNEPDARPWLRALLIVTSFLGYLADSAINGTPLDPNIVSQDMVAFIGTGIIAYFAHAFYNSMFRRDQPPSVYIP